MTDFHVGQKVVCVNADGFWSHRGTPRGEILPVKGEIYTVRALRFSDFWNGPQLLVAEISNPVLTYCDGRYETGFSTIRFRPLEEKSDSIEMFREIARGVSDGKPIIEDAEYRLPTPEKVRA